MIDRAKSEPSVLAGNFETWYAALKEVSCKPAEKAETSSMAEGGPVLTARQAYLASVSSPHSTPSHSPASSFSSTFSSFSFESDLSITAPRYLHEEYFKVMTSPKGGLGAFAVTNIPTGTIIIEEEPLFTCHRSAEIDWVVCDLSQQYKKLYFDLSCWEGVGKNKADAIYKTNRFETSNEHSVFNICSRFNHACHPFACCTYTWDANQKKLIVSTTRDVIEGEELTISYMGWSVDHKKLKRDYGFDCDCPGCLEPQKIMAEEVPTEAVKGFASFAEIRLSCR